MIIKIAFIWWVLINVLAFIMMGMDKRRARHRRRTRIPERTLFLVAVLGGALGILLGMKVFRHKTRHNSFRYGMPGLLLGQMAVIMYASLQNL